MSAQLDKVVGGRSMQSVARMQRITEELDRRRREEEQINAIVEDNDEDDRISGSSCASIFSAMILSNLPSLPFKENGAK